MQRKFGNTYPIMLMQTYLLSEGDQGPQCEAANGVLSNPGGRYVIDKQLIAGQPL